MREVLPGSVFSESTAAEAVREVAEGIGQSSQPLDLIRMGENAVFQLGPDLVARVARPHAGRDDLRRLVSVARWLEAERVPAVQALEVDQPIRAVGGLWVTVWRSLGRDAPYGVPVDVGHLLRRLHDVPGPTEAELPELRPFDTASRRIHDAPISDADRRFLLDRHDQLEDAYSHIRWELSVGHVHGDASVGNVLLDRQGTPTLIDLDEFSIGPREWDLVLTALYFDRFGWHTADEYGQFVDAYGYDIMRWPGYSTLANVREFLMMTWMAQRAGEGPKPASEVALRIETLRSGGSRRSWNPF